MQAQVGSNDRKFCRDGLEPNKDRRSRWVLLVSGMQITLKRRIFLELGIERLIS